MRIDMKRAARAVKRGFQALWALLAQNLGLKLLSVLFAMFLWSYAITANPSMREKQLTGLYVNVTGHSVLSSRDLATVNLKEVSDAQLRVRVSQPLLSQVTNDNVRVDLDLSGIRAAGKQQVKLRASTTYGSVVQVIPEYVEVEVEQSEKRVVPVNVAPTGTDPSSHWYSLGRTNPSHVTVSGPASVVQTVSSARVTPDMTGRTGSSITAEQYVLLDAQDNVVTESLTCTPSSITVPVDIYPKRLLGVTSDISELTTGQVAEGYEVTAVEVTPSQIEVAADQSLLDALGELSIEPVDVTGMSQTFPKVAKVTALKGVMYLSSEEVAVTVTIEEKKATQKLRNVEIEFVNPPEGKRLTYSARRVDLVRVTGPASVVNALKPEDVEATVNLNGLVAGQYEVPIELVVEAHPEVSCASSTLTVTVTVEDLG